MKIKLILLMLSAACFLNSCGSGSSKKQSGAAGSQSEPETIVELQTSAGTIKVKLYGDTPHHKANFMKLVNDGFYDGVLFHRVIKDYMIQTGDPLSIDAPANTSLGMGGPGYTVPAEILPNHYHKKGALSAARQDVSINPHKESSGSQFYIVQGNLWDDFGLDQLESEKGIKYTNEQRRTYKTVGGTPFLDGEYTIFGEVIEGLSIVDSIANVETDMGDRPLADVKLIKVTIVE